MSKQAVIEPSRPTAGPDASPSAPIAAAALITWLAEFLAAPCVIPWVFAVKTTASGLIALLIAFAFDLDQPKWSLLTVFIVAQPQSGLVLAKSFYRIIGTVVGASVALLLISLCAQERVLFLGALAIWIALCTYASKKARNFSAYGFVLAGYTVVIVGITGAQDPGNAFFTAIARVTEISVGILSAALISRLVLPLSLADSLRRAVTSAQALLCEYVAVLVSGHDADMLRTRLLGQIITIDNQRASAVFEDPDIRARSGALQRLGIATLTVVNVSYLLRQSLARLQGARGAEPGPGLNEVLTKAKSDIELWRSGALDSAGLRRRFNEDSVSLPLARDLYRTREGAEESDAASAAAAIGRVYEFFDAFAAYADVYESALSRQPPDTPETMFSVSNDQIDALWAGLRSALALIALSAFWIFADWPSGTTAVILGSVMTARLATMENSLQAAVAAVVIMSIAALPSFVLVEILLPRAAGFAMFALFVAPMLFCCAYLMGHKKTAGMGFLAGLYFASASGFHDRMTYDPVGFINITIAIILAGAVTAVLFAIVAPDTPAAARRAFVRATRKAFAEIGGSSSLELSKFETTFAAALNRLSHSTRADRADDAATFDAGVAFLGIGRELIRLRERGRPTGSGPKVERAVLHFVSRGDAEAIGQAHQAAEDGAAACLVELREDKLGVSDTRAASRELMAFLAIGGELERSRALFDGWPATAVRLHAV